MKLKKIEISGFKSFADKTVLTFSDGITGIVGPNGCGKSNIADAFRWVLGEQSAKSMRGTKMPDVIFAGTANRSPMNFAEVTITLSDVRDFLPVDYDEVAITRRLHRSGESEYFINRHSVRLKDVQSLLMDTGIGKNAFSIFEQGKIDQIIQYSPLDRRYIFEEAAGIGGFLHRKSEALRKLKEADLNTSRLKDIHQEVEKQIVVLEEQAVKARIYKEHKTEHEQLEKQLFVLKWDNLQTRLQGMSQKQEKQQVEQGAARENIIALEQQLLAAKEALNASEQTLRTASEAYFQSRSDKEIKSRERQSQQERFKENSTKEKRWQQELSSLAEKRDQRKEERIELTQKQGVLESQVAEAEKALHAQRSRYHALEEAVSTLRAQQQTSQQERLKWMQSETQVESELKQHHIRQESLLERQDLLSNRSDTLKNQAHEFAEKVHAKKEEIESATKAVDAQKKHFAHLEERLQILTHEMETTKRSLEHVLHDVAESKARQKALLRLREENEGFSAGSKRLLQESANPKSPLHKLLRGLYEYLAPEGGVEQALAATLRPYAQTLVVEKRTDLETVLAFVEKNQLKDFSLICIEALPVHSKNGSGSLLEKVNDHPLAHHFLKHTYLAETLEQATVLLEKQPGCASYIASGAFLDAQGVLFYTAPGENNAFVREAELKNLNKKIATCEAEQQALQHTLQTLRHGHGELHSERVALDKAIRHDEVKLVEATFGLQRLQGDLDRAQNENKQLETEQRSIATTLAEIATKLTTLTERHTAAKAQGVQSVEQSTQLDQQLGKEATALRAERDALNAQEHKFREIAHAHQKLLHDIQILDVKDLEGTEQEQRLTKEIELSNQIQQQAQRRESEVEVHLQEMEKVLSQAHVTQAQCEQHTTQCKATIDTLDQQLQSERKRATQIDEELYRLSLQQTQFQSTADTLVVDLQERYRLTLEEARHMVPVATASADQLEKQVRSLRNKMDSAGDINMTSIEEFDKHKERYHFLSHQIEDLNVSRQELIGIITQLDTESRKIFQETFAIIAANFQKNFKILFNGGEAELQFTEAEDILEAGIEIIAKPPGKQMRSISLLSGGEKCMTALALLFAIFEVKQAPFCILDEIDAPLDDANVQRFVNVVKQFIDRCQFIIITHNKRTMSIADVLCGVSMEERGVSKLIAIQFNKDEATEEQSAPTLEFATAEA